MKCRKSNIFLIIVFTMLISVFTYYNLYLNNRDGFDVYGLLISILRSTLMIALAMGIIFIFRKLEYKIIVIFLCVLFILIIRNLDAILNPIIFTEDGVWITKYIHDGLIKTLWYARLDYFVFGNIFLLVISFKINELFFGYNLTNLPYFVAAVAYVFYTISFTFIYVVADKIFKNKYLSYILLITLTLIPLGDTTNEILGRLSNIGYLIPILFLLTIYLREVVSKDKRIKLILVDILLLILINTNPLCFPMLITYIFYKLYYYFRENQLTKTNRNFRQIAILLIITIIFGIIILIRHKMAPPAVMTTESLIIENLIEVLFARSILYPFVFFKYTSLNDNITIVITIIFVIMGIYSFIKGDKKYRRILIILSSTLLLYTVGAIVMRPGLTKFISGYNSTFPDRYFLGQNILSVTIFMCILDQLLLQSKLVKLLAKVLIVYIVVIYLGKLDFLIEFNNSRLNIIGDGLTFKSQILKEYESNTELENYEIPIYSVGWTMLLPKKYVEATVFSK